jgi:hypothetical protein
MNRHIYERAKNKWGIPAQIRMCIEEMSELTTAFMKLQRKYVSEKDYDSRINKIHEEIADVEIMIEQMRLIFNEKEIDKWKMKKLIRLSEMLMNDK